MTYSVTCTSNRGHIQNDKIRKLVGQNEPERQGLYCDWSCPGAGEGVLEKAAWGKYKVFIKYCVFFPRVLESLPPLPRQHSAAIGCTKNCQPIGVTVHSHCVESFKGLLQRCRRGRGLQWIGKNTIFPEHSVSKNVVFWFISFLPYIPFIDA